jgi:signal peptidase II
MPRPLLLVALLFAGLVGCDHATKAVAESELAGRPAHSVIAGVVSFDYHQNHGIAFNLERYLPEAARTPFMALTVLVGLGVLFYAWRKLPKTRLSLETIAYPLIAAGAVGNLADRIIRGYVVDFIHVRYWPVFNVADVALVVGLGLLLFGSRPAKRGTTSA